MYKSALSRGALESLVLRIIGVLTLMTMHLLAGNTLGPHGYGILSYAIATATVLASITTLGWPTLVMRFIQEYKVNQRWEQLRGVLTRAHQVVISTSLVIAGGLFIFIFLGIFPDRLFDGLFFSAILLPIIAVVILRRRAFIGFAKVRASIVGEEIILPIIYIAWLLVFNGSSIIINLWGYVFACVVVLIIGSIWLWKIIPISARLTISEYHDRYWSCIAFTMLISGIGQIVIGQGAVVILGIYTSMNQVGIFSSSIRIALLIPFVMTAVNIIGTPMMAAAYHSGKLKQFYSVFKKTTIWSVLGAFPVFIIVVIWPGELLGYFGKDFQDGALLLKILACGQFVNAITGLSGSAMIVTGYERQFAILTSSIAAILILSSLVIAPVFGALGVSIIAATSLALMNIISFTFVVRKSRVDNYE